MSVLLGINIDHVATLRQARGTRYPDPVQAALIAEQAGADLEDRALDDYVKNVRAWLAGECRKKGCRTQRVGHPFA